MKKRLAMLLTALCVLGCLSGCTTFTQPETTTTDLADDVIQTGLPYEVRRLNDRDYYIYDSEYTGEHHIDQLTLELDLDDEMVWDEYQAAFPVQKVCDLAGYKAYCEAWNITPYYTDPDRNYILFSYMQANEVLLDVKLGGVEFSGDTVTLGVWDKFRGCVASADAYLITIPTTKAVSKVDYIPLITAEEFDNLKEYGIINPEDEGVAYKPILYFYPEAETDLTVTLGLPEDLTCTYPAYPEGGWQITAYPNGDLTDRTTGRELYSLYYERTLREPFRRTDTGFVVSRDDLIPFFEESLATLGLTQQEAEEFIIYWLPQLQAQPWVYLRFATASEIDAAQPLTLSVTPDTLIRVLMVWEPLASPISVTPQTLTPVTRSGFTVVEWGGTQAR